jgi:hypothetical protein
LANRGQLFGCAAYDGVTIMQKKGLGVGREVRERLDRLHELFGRDQSLLDILDGLIMRLGEARILYGPDRSLPEAVSGLYYLLDELRKLYGSDSIEEIVSGIIDRKRRLNRLVELKSIGWVTAEQHHEIEYLERVQRRYFDNLVRQKAQVRAKNGKAPKLPALPALPAPQKTNGAQAHATNGKNGIANGGSHS